MNSQTVDKLLTNIFSIEKNSVTFTFQGGEPTLAGINYYYDFIEKVNTKNKNGIVVNYSMQTNGIEIDNIWAEFFKKAGFLVGISIDGNESIHNHYRTDKHGKGTYEYARKAIALLKKNEVKYNILCVITNEIATNVDEVYSSIKDLGSRYIQFIPLIGKMINNAPGDAFLSNDNYSLFLINIFDLWYKDLMREDFYSIRFFDNLIFLMNGQEAEQCGLQGRCGIQLTVESNGDVYPCDFYCTDDFLLGNINQDNLTAMFRSANAKKFLTSSFSRNPDCSYCEALKLCQGGCRRYRDQNGKYIYCEAFKKFYAKFIKTFPLIVNKVNRFYETKI